MFLSIEWYIKFCAVSVLSESIYSEQLRLELVKMPVILQWISCWNKLKDVTMFHAVTISISLKWIVLLVHIKYKLGEQMDREWTVATDCTRSCSSLGTACPLQIILGWWHYSLNMALKFCKCVQFFHVLRLTVIIHVAKHWIATVNSPWPGHTVSVSFFTNLNTFK